MNIDKKMKKLKITEIDKAITIDSTGITGSIDPVYITEVAPPSYATLNEIYESIKKLSKCNFTMISTSFHEKDLWNDFKVDYDKKTITYTPMMGFNGTSLDNIKRDIEELGFDFIEELEKL